MGTHNALLSLGPRFYLEVIAVDPEGAKPARPRWFDLDEPRMKAALAEGPQLVHWVARTNDIDAAVARVPDLGTVTPMARGDFTWRITIPDDGHRPGRGLVPTLIQWPDARHPTDRLPDHGLRVAAIAGEHPEPAVVRAELGRARPLRHAQGHVREVAAARGDDPYGAGCGNAVAELPGAALLCSRRPREESS